MKDREALALLLVVLHDALRIVGLIAARADVELAVRHHEVLATGDAGDVDIVDRGTHRGVLQVDLNRGMHREALILDVLEVGITILVGSSDPVRHLGVAEIADRTGRIELRAMLTPVLDGEADLVHRVRQRLLGRLEDHACHAGIRVQYARRTADDFVRVDVDVVAVRHVLDRVVHVRIQRARTAKADGFTAIELRSTGVLQNIRGLRGPDVVDQVARHDRDGLRNLDELLVGLEAGGGVRRHIAFALGG